MTTATSAPVFFVLGGPGSGKGTNCARLVEEFGVAHFSAGDLLRVEAKSDTELGRKIADIINKGHIVPSEITMALLANAIAGAPSAKGYLLDGFPRKMDQALMFEEQIAKARGILYFELPEAEMEARVQRRKEEQAAAGIAGRADDDIEVVRTRFKVNIEQCLPVIEKYRAEGRLTEISTVGSVDEVYSRVRAAFVGYGLAPKA